MKRTLTQYGAYVLAIALMMPLAQAQPTKIQAAFGDDAGTLSKKFTGLARVMAGKYDWKPGQGVRSVGDVFNLIVTKNGMLVGVLSSTLNTGTARPLPIRTNCRKPCRLLTSICKKRLRDFPTTTCRRR